MAYFSDSDRRRIHAWAGTLEGPVDLVCRLTGHPRDQDLETFARNFVKEVPTVNLKLGKAEGGLPHLLVAGGVKVSALPLDRELDPFLAGLSPPGVGQGPGESVRAALEGLEVPAELTLYIAGECPHCPAMVRSLISLAGISGNIRLGIVDAALFEAEAAADRVLSVPCLILDREYRWTGVIGVGEVAAVVKDRDPALLGSESFRLILEEGRASWIVDRMIGRDRLFPGFIRLLTHPLWSVRLGAMVVVEGLAAENPALAATLVAPLWEAFETVDPTIRGDILYALGEAGDAGSCHRLSELADGLPGGELRDAALEALESIRSRMDEGAG
jgi:hypothetical protein